MNYVFCVFEFLLFCCHSVFCRPPNVLFVIVDDLRPSLGIYGDPNGYTPNIDKLTSTSYVFNNVFAQQALCAPSRNSLLTSRRPDTLHLYDFYSYWRESVGNFTTLPQHFKQNGYYTKSIGKVFHPGKSSNFTDDFPYSWSTQPFHPKTDIYKDSKVCLDPNTGKLEDNLICPVLVEVQPLGTLPDIEVAEEALAFLTDKNVTQEKPYFLAVGFHKPHIPFKFPQEYLEFHPLENISMPTNLWRPPLLPTVAWNPWMDVKERYDIAKLSISFPFGTMPDGFTRKIIQSYNAATTYIDDLLGKILKKIDENNTIIVVTSDHGWSLGEHGEFAKYSNFDVATKVPLIIRLPGTRREGVKIDSLVELVDLFPTLVDLTGVSPSLEICPRSQSILCTEGNSLAPLLRQKNEAGIRKMAAFSQYPRPASYPIEAHDVSDRPKLKDIQIMGRSIRTERYRYTEWIGFNHTSFINHWNQNFGRELYDHLIDPDENLNLAEKPELNYTVNMLRKQLILGWRYI